MAFPTAINDQITDSVTQANTKVLGDAPAMALASLLMANSHALANAAQNATTGQALSNVTAQAVTVQGVSTLYCIDTGSTGTGTSQIDGVLGLGVYPKGQKAR
jgi:hypothetical protein